MIKLGDFQVNREQRKIIKDILDSGRITEGKYVKLFEEELAKFLGVKHAIAVTNGTVALQLLSQYFGKSKKVCIPAMTFPATLNAFETTGQNTMLCDIGEDLQINIDSLTETQKKSIDILVPVHLMGYKTPGIEIEARTACATSPVEKITSFFLLRLYATICRGIFKR